jgi:hypothetical protein
MASTIRRVISSEDDSFTEELKENAVAHSTPKPRRRNSSAEMEIMRPSAPSELYYEDGEETSRSV